MCLITKASGMRFSGQGSTVEHDHSEWPAHPRVGCHGFSGPSAKDRTVG